jgi:hypothetical protein
MTKAMLWWCEREQLKDNIQAAADYHEKKYGRRPDLCLVHPEALKGVKLEEIQDITVRPWRSVLPGHLWIGIEEKPTEPKDCEPV